MAGSKVEDIKQLQELVSEHLQVLEPGLKLLDTRAHLGGSTIDLVALDSAGTLTLIALGFVADDEIVLRALEAYSWCLEYPGEVQKLYPAAPASGQTPRVVFVVESRSDGFMRKLKHVRFDRVECVEFHFGLSFTPVDGPRARGTSVASPAARTMGGARTAARPAPMREAPQIGGTPVTVSPRFEVRDVPPPLHEEPAAGVAGVSPPARGVDDAKVSAVREYLQKEFPTAIIYDFYAPDRGAHVFHLQDNQGVIVHSAAMVEDLLNGFTDAQLRQFFDKHKLGRVVRQSGQAGVIVTKSGLKIERR